MSCGGYALRTEELKDEEREKKRRSRKCRFLCLLLQGKGQAQVDAAVGKE